MLFRRSSAFLGLLGLLGLAWAGCEPEVVVRYENEPYEGEAYPDRVPDIVYPARAALVTDSLSDTVTVLDLATGAKVEARPVGRNPVDIDGPHHVALDPAGGVGYVALSYPATNATGPHATHGSSVVPGYVQKVALADLSVLGNVRVDPNPGDIAISDDGKRLVVTHFDLQRATKNPTDIEAARATVAVIDAGIFAPELIPTCVAPHGVALSKPDGATAYVACYGEDRLAVVDTVGGAVSLIDVGPGIVGFGAPSYGPYATRLSADGATLVVASTVSKDIRFFDTQAGTFDLAETRTFLGAPYFPDFTADGKLAVPTQQPDALVLVDLAGIEPNESRTFTKDECELPHEVLVTDDAMFVVCEGDKQGPGKVVMLDATLTIVGSTDVGVFPDAIRVLGGGT